MASQTLGGFTAEEIGQLVIDASRGREHEAAIAVRGQSSLARFLSDVGLTFLADLILAAAQSAWEALKTWLRTFW